MWTTIAFIVTALIVVGATRATLWHQQWARRLPAPVNGLNGACTPCRAAPDACAIR